MYYYYQQRQVIAAYSVNIGGSKKINLKKKLLCKRRVIDLRNFHKLWIEKTKWKSNSILKWDYESLATLPGIICTEGPENGQVR